jgi:Icc-related predicted phosphoesterase
MKLSRLFLLLSCLSCISQNSVEEVLDRYNSHSIPYISVEQLKAIQQKDSVILLDAREPEEFQVSHLKNVSYVGYKNFSAEEIQQHWEKIPNDTDILITHTPPKGILDETNKQIEVGCPYLRKTIETQQPKLHIFGHLHENYGKVRLNNTLFINATSFINNLRISNTPIQVNFPD